LEDRDPTVRRQVSLALSRIGPAAAGPAVEMLRHPDAEIRSIAKRTLLGMQQALFDEASLSVFRRHIEVVLYDANPEPRQAAAQVLENMRATSETGNMVEHCSAAVMAAPDERVRLSAVRHLGTLGVVASVHVAALAQRLADPSEQVRSAAVDVFAQLGSPHADGAVLDIAEHLTHPSQGVRRAASAAMQCLGEAARSHLALCHVALLADESATVRCAAVQALADAESVGELTREQLEALVALSIDEHWCVRLAVAKALTKLPAEAAQEHHAALTILLADVDWRVRRAAAEAAAPRI